MCAETHAGESQTVSGAFTPGQGGGFSERPALVSTLLRDLAKLGLIMQQITGRAGEVCVCCAGDCEELGREAKLNASVFCPSPVV